MSARTNVPRLLSYGVCAIRFAVSGMFAVKPAAMMAHLYGSTSTSPARSLAARHYVARDFLLGFGLLRALRTGRNARGWMLAGTVADLVDLATIAILQADKAQRAKLLAGMTAIVSTDTVITALLRDTTPGIEE
jgi:hypothetical protein